MFHVGQEVMCIADFNDKWPCADDPLLYDGPRKYQVLTVKRILDIDRPECTTALAFSDFPIWYASCWFRPIRKESIDCFTQFLQPVKEDA